MQLHSATPGSLHYEMLEEDDNTPYQKDSLGRFYITCPINVGAADYMSKAYKAFKSTYNSRPLWAKRELIQLANNYQDSHYQSQAHIKSTK
jgi:hypothetical protein